MKRFVLVYNPISGHAALKKRLDYLIDAFERRDCMLIPYRTRVADTKMDAFIREVAPEGVIAAGGDGTFREVATVVLQGKLDLPIAIIGSGTSNDFVSHLGVNRDLEAYIDHITEGRTVASDVGKIGADYFVNVASAGMLTSVAHKVNASLKHVFGKAAYYLRGLGEIPNFHTMQLHIQADGATYDMAAFFFIVVNSTIAGGMKHAAPLAKIDDGKLDLIVVKRCPLHEFLTLVAAVVSGHMDPADKNIFYLQATKIEVSADEPAESDLDGEKGPMLPLSIETIPHALRLYV